MQERPADDIGDDHADFSRRKADEVIKITAQLRARLIDATEIVVRVARRFRGDHSPLDFPGELHLSIQPLSLLGVSAQSGIHNRRGHLWGDCRQERDFGTG